MDVFSVINKSNNVTDDLIDQAGLSLETKLAMIWAFVCLSVIGIIGNSYSVFLLSGKKQRRKKILSETYRVYIIALALADNGMLLFTGILRYAVVAWVYETGRPSLLYEVYLCRWHRFFMHASHNAAVWLLVVMALDRFVAVCFPFRYREAKQNSKKAVQITVVVFVLCFALATPFLAVGPLYVKNSDDHRRSSKSAENVQDAFNHTSNSTKEKSISERPIYQNVSKTTLNSSKDAWKSLESNTSYRSPQEIVGASSPKDHDSGSENIVSGCSLTATMSEESAYAINIVFHILLAFLIPYFVLILLNMVIFRCLHYHNATPATAVRQRLHRRITVMMLVVCCTFIILWLPQALILMTSSDAHSHHNIQNNVLYSLAALSGLLNSALNFILYCMTVKKFRNEAWKSACRIFCFFSFKETLSDFPSNNNGVRRYSVKRSSMATYNPDGFPMTELTCKSSSCKKTQGSSNYKDAKRLNAIPEQDSSFSECDEMVS